jgi:hypothetical protein
MYVMQVQLTQFALKKLDVVVDEFWAEISDSIQTIEVVYEDKMYPPEVSLLPSFHFLENIRPHKKNRVCQNSRFICKPRILYRECKPKLI